MSATVAWKLILLADCCDWWFETLLVSRACRGSSVAMAKGGAPQARPLVLALNGARVELAEVDPSLTLLTYLRTQTALRGTKRGCGEGNLLAA